MAKVLMMVKDEEQPIRIGRMKVKQLKQALKKIQEVINLVQAGEGTSELIEYFMGMDKEPGSVNDALEDKMFIDNILGAFKVLFHKLPDEITELLAIVSGVDEEIIDDQEYDVLFEVFEAIIQENDIKGMIDRAKNTFFMARSKWGVLKASK